jgi:hypothetical protein
MYANAELSAQIGKIEEALRPLLAAVDALGGGAATYARVDAGDRTILLRLASSLEDAALTLRDKATEGPAED